jgi:hypothetical protein
MSARTEPAGIVQSAEILQPNPSKSVFINCPFDSGYRPLLHAIILASVSCGFFPRSAVESGSIADPRMTRILEALFSSRYSIHDLSRCQGEGSEALARFNMPLELGMALAIRHQDGQHDWAVLVPNNHEYLRFVSDLGGFDPLTHDNTVQMVVRAVTSWLAIRPDALPGITPKQVLDLLPMYEDEVLRLTEEWGETNLPWRELVTAAINVVTN